MDCKDRVEPLEESCVEDPMRLDGNGGVAVSLVVRPRSLLSVLLFVLVSCDGGSPTDPFGGSRAELTGVVRDSYGSVWGGVSIGMVRDGEVVASGVTGDDGRYTIRRLRPGHYRVWLQLGRTGPGSFVGEIDLREGQNTFDVVTR